MIKNLIIKNDLIEIYNCNIIDWKKFKDKTILISGANGFLPAYIVKSLLFLNEINKDYNVNVIGLVRNKKKAEVKFIEYLNNKNFILIEQDVCNEINIKEKIDFIIHAASQASPKFYGIDPVGTLKANVVGTINLLELARKNNIESFLYFSSGEVYGILPEDKIPIKEDSYGYVNPCDVRSCYAEGKRMGENICVSYYHQYKIPIKIVRPFHTFGPGMQLDDGRVYADFVKNILQNAPIQLQSDGSAIRAFCYLTDATIGFIKVLLDGINGEAYNVGNPEGEKSILELAKILVNLPLNKNTEIKYLSTKNDNNYMKSPINRNSPNIDKMKDLGWNPKINVQEGFTRTIESYKS